MSAPFPHVAAALLTLTATACAAPAPPAPSPPAPAKAAAPAPPLLPARWIRTGGATRLGPDLDGGTMVLLGGRRALMRRDGSLQTERAVAPEPLEDLALVPTPRGPRLVGCGAHGVYRFDDPLGAAVTLARAEANIEQIGAGPGVIAVWTGYAIPAALIDVETGLATRPSGWPEVPLVALAFADERRGAALFDLVGLAVTTDGGASWRVPPGHDVLDLSGLRQRGGGVRAWSATENSFPGFEGSDAAIDFDQAILGAPSSTADDVGAPAMLRWIRAGAGDPLAAAATGGLQLSPGGESALAVGNNRSMLARVDLPTGALGVVFQLAGKWEYCNLARAAETAWLACPTEDPEAGDWPDPYGLVGVPLASKGPFPIARPVLVHNGPMTPLTSPSGGAALLEVCRLDGVSEGKGLVCVRQPGGAWETMALGHDLDVSRGEGPLADGRIAFLRGLGDEASGSPDAGAPGRGLRVVAVGPSGEERLLVSLAFTPSRGKVRVQSPIEEDADHTLRFIVADDDGPLAIVATPGAEPAVPRRIEGVTMARLLAGHGLALGPNKLLASADGGVTWSAVAAPPGVLAAAGKVAASHSLDGIELSEVGFQLGTWARLGWGPPAPETPIPALAGPRLPNPWARPRDRALTCTGTEPVKGTPPLFDVPAIQTLLEPARATHPAHALRYRQSTHWPLAGDTSLHAVVRFVDECALVPADAAATWRVRWYDPQEIGGLVHDAVVTAPDGARSSRVVFAAASGGQALLEAASGDHRLWLVRIAPGAAPEIAEVPEPLAPTQAVVFGAAPGGVVAWAHDRDKSAVVAWIPGQAPRVVAVLAQASSALLGTPTRDGVPLLLSLGDRSLLRVLPIPAAGEAPLRLGLDGWTRLPPLDSALPVCGPRSAGRGFSSHEEGMRVTVDGLAQSAAVAFLDVRVAGSEMCLKQLTVALAPTRGGERMLTGMVRADLASKRAEGATRIPEAIGRRLRCTLE